jgi:PIN domain-containing protein
MGARPSKSKKRSVGNEHSLSQPDDFTLYLDENLCNAAAILAALKKLGVRFERHLDHFPRGSPDESWLPDVGSKGWILLTTDKCIRYNFIEKRALERNRVREFVFASGNMSGQEMASALEIALRKMRKFCRQFQAPFVAAITRSGEVHMRWPKRSFKEIR